MASKGGSKTKGGLYWKKGKWEMVTVERKNGSLPGTEEDAYLRIPALLVPPVALVLGLGFYLFLPFIGFAMLMAMIGKKIWSGLVHSPILADYVLSRKRETVNESKMPNLIKLVPHAQPEYVSGIRLPAHVWYHPGHTWALRESPTLVRVGIDELAGHFIGGAENIELPKRGSWIRQGQKIFTILKNGSKVELVSPIEGEVTAVNEAVTKNPTLAITDPYGDGWLLTVVSPDAETNFRNLLSGNLARQWMMEAADRLRGMMPVVVGAVAQGGGAAISDLPVCPDDQTWNELTREFFLI